MWAGGKALPPAVMSQIAVQTDGVPLFIEELTKMVLESGLLREGETCYDLKGPLPPLAIPATLHDSLMARLDRLGPVKAVAQQGATIGRTFAYDLLQAVAALDEATLQQGLRQLVETELVYQRGIPPQATYTFKHALIQDAAYQSLLRSTPAVSPTHCTGGRGPLSRDRGDAARTAGASLHRGRPQRAGHRVLAAGRSAGESALCICGSNSPSYERPGARQYSRRIPRPRPNMSWRFSSPWGPRWKPRGDGQRPR